MFTIGKSAVAGCYVTNGKLQRNCRVRVRRGKEMVFEGDLDSLRRNKDDVKEVATGFECGVGCDRFANWEEGDMIEGLQDGHPAPQTHHLIASSFIIVSSRREPLLWLHCLAIGAIPLELLMMRMLLAGADFGPVPGLERLLLWAIAR